MDGSGGGYSWLRLLQSQEVSLLGLVLAAAALLGLLLVLLLVLLVLHEGRRGVQLTVLAAEPVFENINTKKFQVGQNTFSLLTMVLLRISLLMEAEITVKTVFFGRLA